MAFLFFRSFTIALYGLDEIRIIFNILVYEQNLLAWSASTLKFKLSKYVKLTFSNCRNYFFLQIYNPKETFSYPTLVGVLFFNLHYFFNFTFPYSPIHRPSISSLIFLWIMSFVGSILTILPSAILFIRPNHFILRLFTSLKLTAPFIIYQFHGIPNIPSLFWIGPKIFLKKFLWKLFKVIY